LNRFCTGEDGVVVCCLRTAFLAVFFVVVVGGEKVEDVDKVEKVSVTF